MTPAAAGFTHEAAFLASEEDLLGAVVPFAHEGLDRGEPVVLACTRPTTERLLAALEGDPRVGLLVPEAGRRRVSATITACQELVERRTVPVGRRVRLVGEPAFWSGHEHGAELGRVEAVANHLLAPYPLWKMCLYDAARLPPSALAQGALTHPFLWARSVRRPNPQYLDPELYVRRNVQAHPDPLEGTPPALEVRGLGDLQALRRGLLCVLGRRNRSSLLVPRCDRSGGGTVPGGGGTLPRAVGPHVGRWRGAETVDDFVVAVNEVATNALRHGVPPVTVRAWAGVDRFVCTVEDHGDGFDTPFAGYASPEAAGPVESGMGLWLARQLCDQIDLIRRDGTFTVRLRGSR